MQGSAISFCLAAALFAGDLPCAAGAAYGDPHQQVVRIKKKPRVAERPFGREGDPRKVKRVIKIETSDAMRFFPEELSIKRGDTVRFVISNSGRLPHGMVLGTMEDLKKQAALMKQNGDLGTLEAHAVQVAPGGAARMVWQFTKAGEFYYACLHPGHFDAGMIGTIVVR